MRLEFDSRQVRRQECRASITHLYSIRHDLLRDSISMAEYIAPSQENANRRQEFRAIHERFLEICKEKHNRELRGMWRSNRAQSQQSRSSLMRTYMKLAYEDFVAEEVEAFRAADEWATQWWQFRQLLG